MKRFLNNIRITATLLAATMLLSTSCLDKEPGSAIPEAEAMQDFNDAKQFLIGIYANMMGGSLWSGYLTILPDLQADMVYAVDGYSNVYGDIWQWNIRPTNAEIEAVYGSLYMVIANCNFFLERIDAVIAKQTDDAAITELDTYKGEVYAIRALCYSELLKNYCKAYDPATAQNELGVVIRTKYSEPEEQIRASLYDSYQFVLEDLREAEERLDPANDWYCYLRMSHGLVCALRARVALNMQDWESAISYSSKVIDHPHDIFALSSTNVNYTSTSSYFDYMWEYDLATEVIWQIGFTTTSFGGSLGSIFLNITTDYTYFYPDYVPAQWVLDLYTSGDGRYDAYFQQERTGYAHGLTWPLLVKYFGNQDFINTANIFQVSMPKPFRLAEQYLIRAEAYCRQATPNYTAASKDMATLRAARLSSGGAMTLTADNCIEQIANERVRELYMEGFRLNDLKRWGKLYKNGEGFTRKPQTLSLEEGSSLSIKMDNPLFVWPIPQHEIESPGSQIQPNESNL
ncbi:MAG: RagB/SusD family nutrient uptake outer membrane protein [Rikenellaceae bacterium]|nr:RagB/SusD family nutrient uptake outer membrane protein [Rikenellaceae bacterium]